MKIGVIGSGVWGSNHARALARLGALGGVADSDPERSRQLAENTLAPVLSADAMLEDPVIDGVVLALPPELHASFALRVLNAGKHLLVEKPMALDAASAQAIVDLAKARRRTAMTGHLLRFHPAFEKLARLIKQRAFGALRHIETSRLALGKFYAATDALWDLAPHDLSLILALTEAPAASQRMECCSLLSAGMIDSAHLHLAFHDGVTAHCHISRLSPARRERRLTAFCEQATLVFDDAEPWGRKLAIYSHLIEHGHDRPFAVSVGAAVYIDTPHDAPLDRELTHFLTCIETGSTPISDVSEGLAVLQIIERLKTTSNVLSLRQGNSAAGLIAQGLVQPAAAAG